VVNDRELAFPQSDTRAADIATLMQFMVWREIFSNLRKVKSVVTTKQAF
jgi:hypothetical protein